MAGLRNVIVFSIGARGTTGRYAVELRWVREVVSLGFITNVPTAPLALSGVCNLHGTILPVLDIAALIGHPPAPPARQGDGALVIETEGLSCALRIDQVDHVASLHETAGSVIDTSGSALTLLDPAALVRRAFDVMAQATAPGARPA